MDLRREFVVRSEHTAHHSLCEEELSEHAPLISQPLWHSIQKWLWYSTQVGKLRENEGAAGTYLNGGILKRLCLLLF